MAICIMDGRKEWHDYLLPPTGKMDANQKYKWLILKNIIIISGLLNVKH